jgi:hypothetical protein
MEIEARDQAPEASADLSIFPGCKIQVSKSLAGKNLLLVIL